MPSEPVSHWFSSIPGCRAALPGDRDADVCIVGAGYTGLWTAYYLKRADPSLRIMVLEARYAGFGASGRNGDTLTELPWVNHTARNWEPEPLRWLGVRGLYLAYKLADWHEARGRSTTSPIAKAANLIARRP